MPVLDNQKEELVAQGIAKGMTQLAAYTSAGFKEDDGNAQRYVTGNDRVLIRVKELQAEMAEQTKIDANWITEKLTIIVEKCMESGVVKNKDGDAIGYNRMDPSGANSSLDKLAKHVGYYGVDNKQQNPDSKVSDQLKEYLKDKGVEIGEDKGG